MAPPPIFLHIGAMKTGTTFLQHLLSDNKELLAEAGYLVPGAAWGRQVRAAQDVLFSDFKDPKIRAGTQGAWQAMADRMLRHDGAGCVFSMEFLSFADPTQVSRIVTSLQPAPVHVILTVRDATATIPAHWQTTVRSGRTTSWPEFMRAIRQHPGLLARLTRSADPALVRFRRSQDIDRMLRAWRRHVPRERLHVVTVPPRGSEPRLLWDRFSQVVGLDPDLYASPTTGANSSLGYASTELLRRVNVELGEVLPTDYNGTLRDHLAARVLSRRSAEESAPRLGPVTYEFGLDWNRRTRKAVLDAGAAVTGELDDLPVTPTAQRDQTPDDGQPLPADGELLAAAATAVDAMRELVARRARRAEQRGTDVDLALQRSEGAGSGAWETSPDPVSAAAKDIAELCRTAIDLRRRLGSGTGTPPSH